MRRFIYSHLLLVVFYCLFGSCCRKISRHSGIHYLRNTIIHASTPRENLHRHCFIFLLGHLHDTNAQMLFHAFLLLSTFSQFPISLDRVPVSYS